MGLVLDLRGGNTATVRDMVNLRKHIDGRFHRLETLMQSGHVGEGSMRTSRAHSSTSVDSFRKSKCFPREAPGKPQVEWKVPIACHTPGFKDVFRTMNDLLAAHEGEVAKLQAENTAFKERHAASSGCAAASSLSAAVQLIANEDLKRTDEPQSRSLPEEDELQSSWRKRTWLLGPPRSADAPTGEPPEFRCSHGTKNVSSGNAGGAVHLLPRLTGDTMEDVLEACSTLQVTPWSSSKDSQAADGFALRASIAGGCEVPTLASYQGDVGKAGVGKGGNGDSHN